MHDVPLAQLLALTACNSWAQGMEPKNGAYEEREFEREMVRIKARDAGAQVD